MGTDDKPGDGAGEDGVVTTDQPSDVVPHFTPEAFQQMLQEQFSALVGEVFGILSAFAPHLDEQQAMKFAQSAAKEQMDQTQIPAIIRSMINESDVRTHPTLHLYVGDDKSKVEMKGPKRLEQVRDLHTAAQSAVLLAFLLSPGARAVLRAFGFRYHLAQSKTPAGGLVISGL